MHGCISHCVQFACTSMCVAHVTLQRFDGLLPSDMASLADGTDSYGLCGSPFEPKWRYRLQSMAGNSFFILHPAQCCSLASGDVCIHGPLLMYWRLGSRFSLRCVSGVVRELIASSHSSQSRAQFRASAHSDTKKTETQILQCNGI